MDNESFSERLTSLIKGHCSARIVAKQAGLSQAVMNKYLHGESTPNLPRLFAIAKALNVRLGWLVSGTGTKEAEKGYFLKVNLDLFHLRLNDTIHKSTRSFAEISDITGSGIHKYLKGESTPNVERLVNIAKAGGVSTEWLATGIEEMDNEDLQNYSALGKRIEEAAQGFVGGKKKLAAMAGISEAQLHRYIAGTSQPTINPLIEIAKASGFRLEWLATGNGSKHETQANIQTLPHRKFLKYLDRIELTGEHKVYANVPCHFVKANKRGDFSLTNHAVTLIDNFDYLQGVYFVANTEMTGGCMERGIPDGYKVTCTSLDGKHTVSFYQSGDFPALIENITPIKQD